MSVSQKMKNKIEREKNALSLMISNDDFNRYIDDATNDKILKYSELRNYNTIYDLLPSERDYKIILTESSLNTGHWCAVLRYNNTFEWFDSYGCKPDGELRYIVAGVRKMLGEDIHYLSKLIKTIHAPDKFIYNKKKFQVLKDGINTCGRWCILRIMMFKNGYDLPSFINFIDTYCINNDIPSDIAVVQLTS
jgi:hypothetical protein